MRAEHRLHASPPQFRGQTCSLVGARRSGSSGNTTPGVKTGTATPAILAGVCKLDIAQLAVVLNSVFCSWRFYKIRHAAANLACQDLLATCCRSRNVDLGSNPSLPEGLLYSCGMKSPSLSAASNYNSKVTQTCMHAQSNPPDPCPSRAHMRRHAHSLKPGRLCRYFNLWWGSVSYTSVLLSSTHILSGIQLISCDGQDSSSRSVTMRCRLQQQGAEAECVHKDEANKHVACKSDAG